MKRKHIKNTIKEYFFTNSTTKLRVREIERELDLPLPSVINYTKDLVEEKVLKKIVIGTVTFFSADRSSEHFLLQKKLFNIKEIYKAGLVKHLIKEYSNPTIILFGSYSKGEDIEESDIDIYIESPKKSNIAVDKFEKRLKRNIQLHVYKSTNQVKNKFLANNILNGINLNGFIEVFK